MPLGPAIILYVYICIVGLCLGSFCGVLIDRIPQGRSIAKGRSACPSCGHTLAGKDLIPLLSWLILKGRCRYCGAGIPVRSLFTELLGGILTLVPVLVFGFQLNALFAALAGLILMCVAFIDADTQEIPDSLVLAMFAVAILAAIFTRELSLLSRGIGLFAVSVPLLLINLIKPTSFGGGDIKLCAAAGALLGWRAMLVAAFLALLGGGGWGIWLLTGKKADRHAHFAFGPFLAAGIWIGLLFGETLIGWYLNLFRI